MLFLASFCRHARHFQAQSRIRLSPLLYSRGNDTVLRIMSTISIFAIAFGIGVIDGLRSMTAPAVVTWAIYWRWFSVRHTALSFLDSNVAMYVFTALAIGELVADKLPKTPNRTAPIGLIARIIFGGLSGAAICVGAKESLVIGAILGAIGGVAGAFAGYQVRTRLVKALKVPDFVIALLEDAVAIGGGFFLASRL